QPVSQVALTTESLRTNPAVPFDETDAGLLPEESNPRRSVDPPIAAFKHWDAAPHRGTTYCRTSPASSRRCRKASFEARLRKPRPEPSSPENRASNRLLSIRGRPCRHPASPPERAGHRSGRVPG